MADEELGAQLDGLLRTESLPSAYRATIEQVFGPLTAAVAEHVKLPSFDKASDNQRGPEQLKSFNGPADVVIFEGWCVGARPEAPGALLHPINELERNCDPRGVWRTFVNEALGRYQSLFSH